MNGRGVKEFYGCILLVHQHPDFRAAQDDGFSPLFRQGINDPKIFFPGSGFCDSQAQFLKNSLMDIQGANAFYLRFELLRNP